MRPRGPAETFALTPTTTLEVDGDRADIYRMTPEAGGEIPTCLHLSAEAAQAWLDLAGGDAAAALLGARPVVDGGPGGDRRAPRSPPVRRPRRVGPRPAAPFRTVAGIAPGSAALTLAHVAAGWADVAYDSSINAWDIAAGLLLVRQAGGTYVRLGGEPGGDDWEAPGYLACGAASTSPGRSSPRSRSTRAPGPEHSPAWGTMVRPVAH